MVFPLLYLLLACFLVIFENYVLCLPLPYLSWCLVRMVADSPRRPGWCTMLLCQRGASFLALLIFCMWRSLLAVVLLPLFSLC